MKMYLLLILFSGFCVCAFKDVEKPASLCNGWWLVIKEKDSTMTAIKNREFDSEHWGFYIGDEGKYIHKANKYRCAVPPIEYKNYKGQYSQVSDSVLHVSYKYRRGSDCVFDIHILSLNSDTMVYQVRNYKF